MLEYIHGRLAELSATAAIVDVNGVGYELNITLNTYSELEKLAAPSAGSAATARLYVHEVIREDAWVLYGFATKRERELFRDLIGVSGVGAASARMILSGITPAELEQVISTGDERRLKMVKGIGGKTAQRIIVDLRDKIKPLEDSLLQQPGTRSEAYDDALAALVTLGNPRAAAEKALNKLFAENPGLTVQQAIKMSFPLL
jgi:holliday junction DNA helicase ruvA